MLFYIALAVMPYLIVLVMPTRVLVTITEKSAQRM